MRSTDQKASGSTPSERLRCTIPTWPHRVEGGTSQIFRTVTIRAYPVTKSLPATTKALLWVGLVVDLEASGADFRAMLLALPDVAQEGPGIPEGTPFAAVVGAARGGWCPPLKLMPPRKWHGK